MITDLRVLLIKLAESFFHGLVEAQNAAAPAYPEIRVDAIKPGGAPDGKDIASTETGHVFLAKTPELFTHDDDGNLTHDGRWTYTWNGENRLVAMETTATAVAAGTPREKYTFLYDHQGRRRLKQRYAWNSTTQNWELTTTSLFLYDGWNLLLEARTIHDSPSTSHLAYTWGLDLSNSLQGAGGIGGLLFTTTGSASSFAAADGNGNITLYLAATDATETATFHYSPFGQTLAQTGQTDSFAYRFSSKYTDPPGLVYYGYRYYDCEKGRWLNRDPIGEKGSNGLYSIADNGLVNSPDILGLLPIWKQIIEDVIIRSTVGPYGKSLIYSHYTDEDKEMGRLKYTMMHFYSQFIHSYFSRNPVGTLYSDRIHFSEVNAVDYIGGADPRGSGRVIEFPDVLDSADAYPPPLNTAWWLNRTSHLWAGGFIEVRCRGNGIETRHRDVQWIWDDEIDANSFIELWSDGAFKSWSSQGDWVANLINGVEGAWDLIVDKMLDGNFPVKIYYDDIRSENSWLKLP